MSREKQPTGKVQTCSSRVSGNVRVWEAGLIVDALRFGQESFPFSLGQVDSSDRLE